MNGDRDFPFNRPTLPQKPWTRLPVRECVQIGTVKALNSMCGRSSEYAAPLLARNNTNINTLIGWLIANIISPETYGGYRLLAIVDNYMERIAIRILRIFPVED